MNLKYLSPVPERVCPASVGFRMNPPVGTHFLDGRVGGARVIGTFFTWESDFLHKDSILQNIYSDKYK